jgi:ABC-type polysaccharide/polyol phosphate export permease
VYWGAAELPGAPGSLTAGHPADPMTTVAQFISSRELLWNLTLRELRTKYRRSFLGWAWSMLNPLANVLVYSFVFGVLMDAEPPVGAPSGLDNFALFLLCGLLPWNFFAFMNQQGMAALVANSGLVRRVAFPRETLVIAQSLHGLVQFCIEMTLLVIILLIAGSMVLPWLPVTILLMLLLAVFGTGFALALSALSVHFRDMNYLWSIVLQVWFFATPIVYPPSLLESRGPEWAQELLKLNPMARFAAAFRRTLYDGTAPGWKTVAALVVISIVSLVLGWMIFNRLSRRIAEEI